MEETHPLSPAAEDLPSLPLPRETSAPEEAPAPEDGAPEATPADAPTAESAPGTDAPAPADDTPEPDYQALAARDLAALGEIYPEYRTLRSLCDLPFALRFAQLRDLGLTVPEAAAACRAGTAPAGAAPAPVPRRGTAGHLHSLPHPLPAPAGGMTREELMASRELFGDLSDAQIQQLYRKVAG